MAIKGLGGSKNIGQSQQGQQVGSSKKFGSILESKKQITQKSNVDRVKAMSPQSVKGRLAQLIQGGAPTKQVVAQALEGNPLFKTLPLAMKEDLINKVSEQMDPLLGKVS